MPFRDAARLLPATIPGPAGSLEALLRLPAEPAGAAVVAHPHPLHRGTMHNKVVHRMTRLLAESFGFAALRFNFRGVGASEGEYGGGPGETADLVAAARWLRARHPGGPLVVAGFSFGSVCALHAATALLPDALVLIGVPTGRFPAPPAVPPSTRVFWIQGEEDEYSHPEKARALAEARLWEFAAIPEADHFFTGRLEAFGAAAEEGLRRALEGGSG